MTDPFLTEDMASIADVVGRDVVDELMAKLRALKSKFRFIGPKTIRCHGSTVTALTY